MGYPSIFINIEQLGSIYVKDDYYYYISYSRQFMILAQSQVKLQTNLEFDCLYV